jgi:hypothetical protein
MLEIDLLQKCEIEFHDLAVMLIMQLSADLGFDGLLVAGAPVDILRPGHRSEPTRLSGPALSRDLDPSPKIL